MNRDQIRNPHRIYPGNVILIDRSTGRLAMAGTVKLSPRVRTESLAGEAIPTIPPQAIEPFLSRPLLIEPDGIDYAPRIVALDEGRVVAGDGGKAFVSGMGGSKEASWSLYRRGNALIDPDSNTTLGYEAIYLGTAKVLQAGEPATIELASVTQEIGIGDRLVIDDEADAGLSREFLRNLGKLCRMPAVVLIAEADKITSTKTGRAREVARVAQLLGIAVDVNWKSRV